MWSITKRCSRRSGRRIRLCRPGTPRSVYTDCTDRTAAERGGGRGVGGAEGVPHVELSSREAAQRLHAERDFVGVLLEPTHREPAAPEVRDLDAQHGGPVGSRCGGEHAYVVTAVRERAGQLVQIALAAPPDLGPGVHVRQRDLEPHRTRVLI